MKTKLNLLLLLVIMGVSGSAFAHRFSTSFLTMSSATEGTQSWTWRIVEHDLDTLVNSHHLTKSESDDKWLDAIVKRLISVNEGCEVQVEQSGNMLETVYAGQTYVDLNGQIICVGGSLSELSVETVFSSISDHKVVLAIPSNSTKQVLSLSQTNWKK